MGAGWCLRVFSVTQSHKIQPTVGQCKIHGSYGYSKCIRIILPATNRFAPAQKKPSQKEKFMFQRSIFQVGFYIVLGTACTLPAPTKQVSLEALKTTCEWPTIYRFRVSQKRWPSYLSTNKRVASWEIWNRNIAFPICICSLKSIKFSSFFHEALPKEETTHPKTNQTQKTDSSTFARGIFRAIFTFPREISCSSENCTFHRCPSGCAAA